MRLLSACFALLSLTEAVSFFDLVLEEWKLFKVLHNKSYSSAIEENFRLKIYMENKKYIAKHNTLFDRGLVNYSLGMNQFGDMLHHEFVSKMNGFKQELSSTNSVAGTKKGSYFMEPANVVVASSVDWRAEGAVTPVKDQGSCGSCWAFSSTGSLEGQHFRKTGELVSLSEQNLIDCSKAYGNDGCSGGLMDLSFKYIRDNNGLDTEDAYPYEAENDKCRYNPDASVATDSGFVDLPRGDENRLQLAVATVGPISVAIDAGHKSFQFYKHGVYYEPECRSRHLNHAVLVVGYDTENDSDFWLVKNSWGTHWGDQGYIKMARNKDNNCGIASTASYPLV